MLTEYSVATESSASFESQLEGKRAGAPSATGVVPPPAEKSAAPSKGSKRGGVGGSPVAGVKGKRGKGGGGSKRGSAGTAVVPLAVDLRRKKKPGASGNLVGAAAGVIIVMVLFRLMSARNPGRAFGAVGAILLAPATLLKLIFGGSSSGVSPSAP